VPEERGQRVGLHRRFGRSGEADVRFAAVRPVPDEHPVPLRGEGLGQLAHAGVVLAEPATRGDRPGPTLADHLEGDGHAVHCCPCHRATLTSTRMLNGETLIIDADSHWTEPHDLFTRAAPPAYRDRVPRVETIDGQPKWVFDGHELGM